MDLIKTKEREIQKLTSYILKTFETNHPLPPVVTYFGSVSVLAEYNDGIFLPYQVHFVVNGEKWYSISGKVPKNLSAHAAKSIWEEMHKRATEKLLKSSPYVPESRNSDIKKLNAYIRLGCKSEKELAPLRFIFGLVSIVSKDVELPHFSSNVQLLINGKYRYSMMGKSVMDQIPFHVERILTMMRFLVASELEKQDGHRINAAKFNRRFVQSYPPSKKQ